MFFVRKKQQFLLQLCIQTYTEKLSVYKNNLQEQLAYLSDKSSDQEIKQRSYNALQKYYAVVFDTVCGHLSHKYPTFQKRYAQKIFFASNCGYDIDVSNLAAGSVYAFSYWLLTNRTAPSGDCIAINHYVHALVDRIITNNQF